MANLWVSAMILSIVLVILDYAQSQNSPNLALESTSQYDFSVPKKLPVFKPGKYKVTNPINVEKSQYSAPEPLLIVSPKEAGLYPVLFFIHGTLISNEDYSSLIEHVASHGYIVVAPKLFTFIFLPSQSDEIEMAASVLNWLPSKNLEDILLKRVKKVVKADLQKVAVSGHSRGGKSAFALALGIISQTKLNIKINALIGVDPVAGPDNHSRTRPYVLTYEENSFDLSIPVTVIGTGLGSKPNLFFPPCAPSNVSHQEFFNECKQGSHFVIKKYGHMQMLNDFLLTDPLAIAMSSMCTYSNILYPKSTMRETLGGIMVAFLDAYFGDDDDKARQYYYALIANSSLAPTELSVQTKGNLGFAPAAYAQA